MPRKSTQQPLPRYVAILLVFLGATSPALGTDFSDPLDTDGLHAAGPADSHDRALKSPCQPAEDHKPLTLTDVVDRALCNNPQTREAWANARYQAAQVGIARSAYLPSVSATASRSRVRSSGFNSVTGTFNSVGYNQTSAGLSFNFLLYDFGGRSAALENAREIMSALAATQDATLQSIFLAAVQAYYQRFATEAIVSAARESERVNLESLKAAEERYKVGVATPADRLQAKTAASQATLTRVQAEGNARNALGTLANVMGLDAQEQLAIAPPPTADVVPPQFEQSIDELIAEAKRSRPDLAAAEAQVRAARAGIDSARATGLPTISLFGSSNYNDTSISDPVRGTTLGLSLNVPLFTGFNTTYRVRAAEAQLDVKSAQRDRLSRQVSLDVWQAYHALMTGTESVRASTDLLASAQQSADVALGRYKAGVGGILDVLNAQSALASARQQNIQALYNWRIARVALAQAMGQLDFPVLETADK